MSGIDATIRPGRLRSGGATGLALLPMLPSTPVLALADMPGESNAVIAPDLPLLIVLAVAAVIAAIALLAIAQRRQVNAHTRALRHRNRQLAIVNRTLHLAGTSLDLDRILREATRGALDLSGLDYGVMSVYDTRQDQMRLVMRVDGNRKRGTRKVIASEKTCPPEIQQLVEDRPYVLINAAETDIEPLCAEDSDQDIIWHAYFSLRASGQNSGLMCLYSRHARSPNRENLELISELCLAVALAIENTRLFDEAQQHSRELEERVEVRTRELAESSAFWQALIDHVPSPIFYKDTDLLFLGCNQAYERAFGVSRRDIVGKKVLDLDFLSADDRLRFQREQEQVMATGGTLHHEIEIPHADGGLHQMLYSATSFQRPDGNPGGIVGVLVDITEQKQAEAELAIAKDVAESADRVKSAFLATMSHELRTPLNSIIGFTGILLQELAGPLNDEQNKQLGMVRNSARHLLALINDVLDISKIEAGELSLASETFSLESSLHKIVEIARPLAECKGLELAEDFDDGLGHLQGDSRRLEQVVLNLISNAIKFTRTGTVTVSATAGMRDADNPEVCIRVIDTGVGIQESDLGDLFTPFRQIDSRLSREHEGTGLGLAICKRLTEMMGGCIEVNSRYGQGSEFIIKLPLHTQVQREAS